MSGTAAARTSALVRGRVLSFVVSLLMASRGASPPFRARFSSRALSFFNFSFRRFFFLRSSSDEEEDDEEDDDEEDEEDEVDGDRLRRPIFGMRSDTDTTVQG